MNFTCIVKKGFETSLSSQETYTSPVIEEANHEYPYVVIYCSSAVALPK